MGRGCSSGGGALCVALLLSLAAQGHARGRYSPGVVFSGLAPRKPHGYHHLIKLAEATGNATAVPVVPVADNYDAAQSADLMITKALEHGVLSAAQAKAILAAAKVAAQADEAKVAAAKKIIEAAKEAEGESAKEAAAANQAAAESAQEVTDEEKKLKEAEERAGPPAAIAQEKQASLNSANQRLAAAMAYGATQTRNMDRALAAEMAATAAETARAALMKAKADTDSAVFAARNLADVSGTYSGPEYEHEDGSGGEGGRTGRKPDASVGEKVGIVIFFLLLAGALLFWFFAFGRSSSADSSTSQGMANPQDYGTAGSSYGTYRQDTTV